MENQSSAPILQPALKYGAIVGLASIVFGLILYFLDQSFETWAMIAGSIISFGLIIVTLVMYRSEYASKGLSYGRVVGMAVLIGLFSSILSGIYTFTIYTADEGYLQDVKYYSMEKVDERMDKTEAKYMDRLSDDQLDAFETRMDAAREKAMGKIKKSTPFTYARQGIFGSVFMSALLGLIAGIFLRKKPEQIQS